MNSAIQLQKEGYDVTVVDEQSDVAMVCSKQNGCQISVCNSHVWNSKRNVYKGIKWLFSKTAPLRISPSFDMPKFMWLKKFCENIQWFNYNSRGTAIDAAASRDEYLEIFKELGFPSSYRHEGISKMYRSKESFELGLEEAKQLAAWVKEPYYTIDGSKLDGEYYGSIVYPKDFTMDTKEYCLMVKQYLSHRNVKFIFDTKIAQIIRNADAKKFQAFSLDEEIGRTRLIGEYDFIVECTGRKIKNHDIYPVKGYSITVKLKDSDMFSDRSILDEDLKIVATVIGTKDEPYLRVAGTAEFNGEDETYDLNHPRIKVLIEWAKKHVQDEHFNDREIECYACLRPMTPDMRPFVEQDDNGIFHHGGHGHLGLTLSMQTAKLLVAKVNSCMY